MSNQVRVDYSKYYVRIPNEVYWFLATIDDHQFRERFEERMVLERTLMSDLQLPLTLLTAVNPYPYPRNTVPSLVECAFNTLPHEIKERIERYHLLSR